MIRRPPVCALAARLLRWAAPGLVLLGAAALARAQEPACTAPEPVCAARAAVFAVSAFDPAASATRIGPDLLVTNRHVVLDQAEAELLLADGRRLAAAVVPSGYPGDLVLLRAAGLDAGPALEPASAPAAAAELYTVGLDVASGAIRAYAPGRLYVEPAPDEPLARLHHGAESRPGNSGGALLDAEGRLVGIVTSGGAGHNEAIPAAALERLRAESGPAFAAAHARLGAAYRACVTALDEAYPLEGQLGEALAAAVEADCRASGNRQLVDLAGQILGRNGRLEAARALFEAALEQDPNAINSRLGLVVTLQLARAHAEAVPHLTWLLGAIPQDPQVLRLAVLSGKLGSAPGLAARALSLLERHHPELAPGARRFLYAPGPPATTPPPG